jgi:hypothetical protein
MTKPHSVTASELFVTPSTWLKRRIKPGSSGANAALG